MSFYQFSAPDMDVMSDDDAKSFSDLMLAAQEYVERGVNLLQFTPTKGMQVLPDRLIVATSNAFVLTFDKDDLSRKTGVVLATANFDRSSRRRLISGKTCMIVCRDGAATAVESRSNQHYLYDVVSNSAPPGLHDHVVLAVNKKTAGGEIEMTKTEINKYAQQSAQYFCTMSAAYRGKSVKAMSSPDVQVSVTDLFEAKTRVDFAILESHSQGLRPHDAFDNNPFQPKTFIPTPFV